MNPSSRGDRRQHARTSVEYQVQLRPINPPQDGSRPDVRFGLSRDISKGGIGILVEYPCQVPSRLMVTFETEYGNEKRVISRLGSVSWITPRPLEERYQVGIRFSDEIDE